MVHTTLNGDGHGLIQVAGGSIWQATTLTWLAHCRMVTGCLFHSAGHTVMAASTLTETDTEGPGRPSTRRATVKAHRRVTEIWIETIWTVLLAAASEAGLGGGACHRCAGAADDLGGRLDGARPDGLAFP